MSTLTEAMDRRRFWWKDEPKTPQMARDVIGTIAGLGAQNADWELANLRFHRLHSGMSAMNGLIGFTEQSAAFLSSNNPRLYAHGPAYNGIMSLCDTLTAKIGGNVPKPMFTTRGGSSKMQKRAKALNTFWDGVAYQTRFFEEAPEIIRSATIFGTGVNHIYSDPKAKQIESEAPYINEMLIDEVDGLRRRPKNIFRRRYVDRSVLLEMFPDDADQEAIESAARIELAFRESHADMVLIGEAWHLESLKGAGDGQYAMCLPQHCLQWKKWTRPTAPFAFLRYATRSLGFWGQGIPERQMALQLEINRVLQVISISHRLVSVPKVWLRVDSKIVPQHVTNEPGGIGFYSTEPPVYMNPDAVNPSLSQYLDTLFNKMFELEGISQLSSASLKPRGLNAGKALDTYHDIETERFAVFAKAVEQYVLDCAELYIEEAKDLAEDTGGFKMHVPVGGSLQELNWKDVDSERDEYVIRPSPINALSDDPSERYQEITNLIQGQLMTPEDGRRALDFPDLEKFNSLADADGDYTDHIIDQLLYEKEANPPDEHQNLLSAIKSVNAAYLRAKLMEDVDEDRLGRFVDWMDQAKAMVAPPAPPEQPAAPGPSGPVTAKPPPAPVGELQPAVGGLPRAA